ncbi:MAG TPA: recombinase family protein [Patescibacteria group bacterium]|nr:recombinase family protein [Patescibacteria group bacterium]
MALIGYARVSTEDQVTDAQQDALRAAGCTEIFEEKLSGGLRARPQLARALDRIRRGDTLIVWKIDRLARSLSHLLDVIERLEGQGAHFRSLSDPIDTGSPQGRFSLQILGAVAELERSLGRERTLSGLKAAKARGRVGGNPLLKARDPEAIRKLSRQRRANHLVDLTTTAEEWLPLVRRLRPAKSWNEVARRLNDTLPPDRQWTKERLLRAVKRFVAEGLADPALLGRAKVKRSDRLLTLVAGIARANPGLTLAQIGSQLEAMRERAPRGGQRWNPSSVKNLLDRARKLDLLGEEAAPV